MAGPIATAFVEVSADTSKLEPAIVKAVNEAMVAATRAVETGSRGIESSLQATFTQAGATAGAIPSAVAGAMATTEEAVASSGAIIASTLEDAWTTGAIGAEEVPTLAAGAMEATEASVAGAASLIGASLDEAWANAAIGAEGVPIAVGVAMESTEAVVAGAAAVIAPTLNGAFEAAEQGAVELAVTTRGALSSVEEKSVETAAVVRAESGAAAEGVGGIGAAAKSIIPLMAAVGGALVLKDAVNEASDLNESINAIRVSLGDAADEFLAFGKDAPTKLGITQSALNQSLIPVASLLRNAGLSGDALAQSLETIASRATDTGSVMNKDVNEVLVAMSAALRGEQEPIRALGVSFDQTAVQAEAVRLGLAGVGEEASTSALTQARLSLILQQTDQFAGDFANTSDGLANSQRILGASVATLEAKLGAALLPTLAKIASFVSFTVIPALEHFGKIVGDGIKLLIAGFDSPDAKFALNGMAQNVIEFGQTLRNIFDTALPILQNVWAFVKDNLVPILASIGAVLGSAAIIGIITAIGAAIAALASPVVLVVAAIAGLVFAFQKFDGFREAVLNVVDFLINDALPIVEDFVGSLIDTFAQAVAFVQEVWPDIQEAITHVANVVKAIWHAVGDDLLTFIRSTFTFIAAAVQAAMKVIENVIRLVLAIINGDWGKAWDAIKGIAAGAFDLIRALVVDQLAKLGAIFGAALSLLSGLWSAFWGFLSDEAAKFWDALQNLVGSALDFVTGLITGFRDLVLSLWTGMWDLLIGTTIGTITGIKNVISGGIDSVVGFFQALPGRISGLAGDIGSAALGIGSTIISKLGEGLSAVVGFAADIGGAIGTAIKNAVNFLIDKVNDALPNSFFGIDLPDNPIPHVFHEGGIVPGRGDIPAILKGGEGVFTPEQMRAMGGSNFVFQVTVNPAAGMSRAEAVSIGEGIADGARDRLMQRRFALTARTA